MILKTNTLCQYRLLATLGLFFCLSSTLKAQQQRIYEYDSKELECKFKYLVFTAIPGDLSYRYPFFFFYVPADQDIEAAFKADTLHLLPEFSDYNFIFVPAPKSNSFVRLKCLSPLSALVTLNHKYVNNKNLFLYLRDTSLRRSQIEADLPLNEQLKRTFKYFEFSSENKTFSHSDSFKAKPVEEYKDETPEYGTFYIDNATDTTAPIVKEPPAVRNYFGNPTRYNLRISGLVKDKVSGEALPYASIAVRHTSVSTQSNADGYFTLINVPNDTCSIEIIYPGYEGKIIFMNPVFKTNSCIITMNPALQTMKAVKIQATKNEIFEQKKEDISVIRLSPKKLELLPNLGEKDIFRSFQLMPGVGSSNESSSGLYVRGGTPDQNLVLFDGFTVYQVDHLYGFYSAFNANAIKDAQLYKGGFEAKYGGRISSVTEITGKDGNEHKFNLGGEVSLLSMNFWTEIPVSKKITSVFTFRKSYKGALYNKIFNRFNSSSQNRNNISSTPRGGGMPGGGGGRFSQSASITSYFYDFNGKISYRPSVKDFISFSILSGTDKLDNSIDNSSLPSFGGSSSNFSLGSIDLTRYGNLCLGTKWNRQWNDRLFSSSSISYSNFFSERERSQTRTITNSSGETSTSKSGLSENNNLKDFNLKSDYRWNLHRSAEIMFGVFASHYHIQYTYIQNDTSTIIDRNNKGNLAGVYLQDKSKFFRNKLTINPGIRFSYFDVTQKTYTEPRLSMLLNMTKKISLKGAFGQYYQMVNKVTREDILSGNKEFWVLSDNSKIPVSSARHYISGVVFENQNFYFSTEGFLKKMNGISEYSLRINSSPRGTSYNENFFSGKGYSKGLEFMLQKKSGKLNGWISYTLSQTKYQFDAYGSQYFFANHDVTHETKLVLLYKWRRWNFAATQIYATGKPYTAPSGAYSITLLDGTSSNYFTVTNKNGLRLPDYHRMDISATFKLLKGFTGDVKRREIGYISFSIFNVYNRKNIWYKLYTIQDSSIIVTNVNYLGFTPNVSLSLKLW